MARADEVTFERITRVYRDESQRKALTPLEPDFWDRVARYVAGLERDATTERAKDPSSKAAMLLEDELRKVRLKREQIYQYRERKIALLASARASGADVEIRGLARQEQEVLDRLVDVLAAARNAALAAKSAPPPSPAGDPGPERAAPEPSPRPSPGVLVRILEDVPPVSDGDVTYRLRKEDLVTLPPPIAKVLVDRGKASVVNPAL